MVTQLPGINISILRQSTAVRRNEPLLISGRVTALGFGIPTLIRVFLEGPSFDPQVLSFDTFSSPISGDYSVSILAEKDGQYLVKSQAFPPFAIPVPGGTPITLPPLAESPSPPIIIGDVQDGNVSVDTPGGRQTFAVPAPSPIEIFAPITVAPSIPITIGGPVGGGIPGLPFVFPGVPVSAAAPDQPTELIITSIIQLPPAEAVPEGQVAVVSAAITGLSVE